MFNKFNRFCFLSVFFLFPSSGLFCQEEVPPLVEDGVDYFKRSQKYKAYSSVEKQFVWIKVYKVASTTLELFFKNHVQDLQRSLHKKKVPEIFNPYFKFAFVRNSWDRVVSCYCQKILTKQLDEFSECFDQDFDYFIGYLQRQDLNTANPHIRSQVRLIPVKECDFIAKFDHLMQDLEYVCDRIGVEFDVLPHENKSEHVHYSKYYTKKTKKSLQTFIS
jgi:hypothetical protein